MLAVAIFLFLTASPAALRAGPQGEIVPLLHDDGEVGERVLEALLAPQEFRGRRFAYTSGVEEAAYSLDSSLSAKKPFAELHPERLTWPLIAGLELIVEGGPFKLTPVNNDVDDNALDRGFMVRWILAPLGQRFDPLPSFAAEVVEVEVLAAKSGRRLFFWKALPPPQTCRLRVEPGRPACDLNGVSRETRAIALSPNGNLLALAIGGLRPRLEVYDVSREPQLVWQSLFRKDSGGAVEVAFSADSEWVVALTGRGRMHRFSALSGGRHMSIPSAGRTARAIPPGRIMAVAGEAGEVNLWYLADGTIAWRLPARQLRGPIDRLAASADGKRFATLEYDEDSTLVRVWEVRKRAMLAEMKVDPYAVADIALDGKGENLFVAHEKDGLLKARVKKQAVLQPVAGKSGLRCRGRLQWVAGLNYISCAVPGGEIQIDRSGKKRGELVTGIQASDWIVAASASGLRLAAVGGGHLFLWKKKDK